jgi:hypothetical protein
MKVQEAIIRRALEWWEKEINDNPNHPTNMYAERERSKLLKELLEYQINTHSDT